MQLKDRDLEKAACFKIGKFGNQSLSEEDFEKVEEISISNRKFSGEPKDVSLEEMRLFPNIKRVFLQYFEIDDSIAEILNSLRGLESLELSSCKFCSNVQIRNEVLKSLYLNCCEIKDYSGLYATEVFSVVGSDSFRLDKLQGKENIERMYLQSSSIKGFRTIDECSKLKNLNLDGTKVDDNNKLEEVKKRIPVSHLEEYLPMR